MSLHSNTISLFKAVVVRKDAPLTRASAQLTANLIEKGIMISNEAAQELVNREKDIQFLIDRYGINLVGANSSFYKTFQEMEEKSDFELRLDQLLHYMSTYGNVEILRNHGSIYEPRELEAYKVASQRLSQFFTKISAISEVELIEKIQELAYSKIAMSESTIDQLMELIVDYKVYIDINEVTNKELAMRLMLQTDLVSEDVDMLMRCIYFISTGKSMIVKSRRHLEMFKVNLVTHSIYQIYELISTYVDLYGYLPLAQNANRYRKMWLVLRSRAKHIQFSKESQLTSIINKVLRLSKTHAIASKQPDMMTITSGRRDPIDVKSIVSTMTIYQLIRVRNAIVDKIDAFKQDDVMRLFAIRTGSTFVKTTDIDDYQKEQVDSLIQNLEKNLEVVTNELVSRLDWSNVVFVRNGSNITYAAPTSQKSFCGDIPQYSYIELEDRPMKVGIYWDQDGDIDLHAMNEAGSHFGWNGQYRDLSSVSYSGDMTSLNSKGFASEYFKFVNLMSSYAIEATRYYGDINNFKLIVARHDQSHFGYDMMVSEDEIIAQLDVRNPFEMGNHTSLGIISKFDDDKLRFVFMSNSLSGSSRIPNIELESQALMARNRMMKNQLTLDDLIEMTNTRIVDSFDDLTDEERDSLEVVDLSPTSITLNDFVEMFQTTEG